MFFLPLMALKRILISYVFWKIIIQKKATFISKNVIFYYDRKTLLIAFDMLLWQIDINYEFQKYLKDKLRNVNCRRHRKISIFIFSVLPNEIHCLSAFFFSIYCIDLISNVNTLYVLFFFFSFVYINRQKILYLCLFSNSVFW